MAYYAEGEVLLQKYEENAAPFQMVILDVELDGMNGLELAEKIRTYDYKVLILFFTDCLEYMQDSFHVQAFAYMKKPISYGTFRIEVLRACLANLHHLFKFVDRDVHMRDGTQLPISRRNIKNVKKEIEKYAIVSMR